MVKLTVPVQAREILLQDAVQRDPVTARRCVLLEILWHERYLTREQLIVRVEFQLGRYCFGSSAWEDNFYRDLRIVKRAFQAAGQVLQYSRKKQHPGYYLRGQAALSNEIRQMLHNCVAEIDSRQIEIYHRLPSSARLHQGFSLSDTARRVVAYRITQEHPAIDPVEANRLALQRMYST